MPLPLVNQSFYASPPAPQILQEKKTAFTGLKLIMCILTKKCALKSGLPPKKAEFVAPQKVAARSPFVTLLNLQSLQNI